MISTRAISGANGIHWFLRYEASASAPYGCKRLVRLGPGEDAVQVHDGLVGLHRERRAT